MTTKKVNIYPSTPIINVIPIIRGPVENATKDLNTIRKCIIARAKVEEILPSGERIILTMYNYDKDNTFTEPESEVKEQAAESAPETNDAVDKVLEDAVAPIKDVDVTEQVVEEPAKIEPEEIKGEEEKPELVENKEETETVQETVAEEAVEEKPEPVATVEADGIVAALDNIDTSDIEDVDDGLDNDEQGL